MTTANYIGEASKDVEIKTFLTEQIDELKSEIDWTESRISEYLNQIETAQESINNYRADAETQRKTKAMYERMLAALEKGGFI